MNNDINEKVSEIHEALFGAFVWTIFNDASTPIPSALKSLKAAYDALQAPQRPLSDAYDAATKALAASKLKPLVLKPLNDQFAAASLKMKKLPETGPSAMGGDPLHRGQPLRQMWPLANHTKPTFYLLQGTYDGKGRFTMVQYQAKVIQLGAAQYQIALFERKKTIDLLGWSGDTDTAEPVRHLYGAPFSTVETMPPFNIEAAVSALSTPASPQTTAATAALPAPAPGPATLASEPRLVRWYALRTPAELRTYFAGLYTKLQNAKNSGFALNPQDKVFHQDITASITEALSLLTGITDAPPNPSPLPFRLSLGNGIFETAWDLARAYPNRLETLRQISAELAVDPKPVKDRWDKMAPKDGQSELDRWIDAMLAEITDRLAHRNSEIQRPRGAHIFLASA